MIDVENPDGLARRLVESELETITALLDEHWTHPPFCDCPPEDRMIENLRRLRARFEGLPFRAGDEVARTLDGT